MFFFKHDEDKKSEYGFIAKEAETVFNNVGDTNNGVVNVDTNVKYSVGYNEHLKMSRCSIK